MEKFDPKHAELVHEFYKNFPLFYISIIIGLVIPSFFGYPEGLVFSALGMILLIISTFKMLRARILTTGLPHKEQKRIIKKYKFHNIWILLCFILASLITALIYTIYKITPLEFMYFQMGILCFLGILGIQLFLQKLRTQIAISLN